MSTRLAQALLLPRPVSYVSARPYATSPPPRARREWPTRTSTDKPEPDAPSSFGFETSAPDSQRRDESPSWLTPRPPGQGKRSIERARAASRSDSRPPLATEGESERRPPGFLNQQRGPRLFSPLHPTWKAADLSLGEKPIPEHLKRHGFFPAPKNPADFVGSERPPQEDTSVPVQVRHPNLNKEVSMRAGVFNLGENWEVDEVGKKVVQEQDVPKAVLTLHMNSLPIEATAQVIYPLLIQAGLHVSTCEAIVDGYRSTVIAELESDEGLNQSLGRLIQGAPMLKNKIEITGNPDTVSDYFTPSKVRVAISNIPLHLHLSPLAKFLHISGIQSIQALHLVRLKSEIQHCGLAFLWTRPDQVSRLVGRELLYEGTRMVVGVARDAPIPEKTNKSEFLGGPKVLVRPAPEVEKRREKQGEWLASRNRARD